MELRAGAPLTSGARDVRRVIFEWPRKQQIGVVRLAIEPVIFQGQGA